MKLFDLLKKDEIQIFNIKQYDTNEVVFLENDLCNKVGFLLQGSIKIITYTMNQKEEIITIINDKSFLIGQYLLFSNNPYYLGDGISLNKTKIAWISKKHLLELFTKNKEFLNAYLEIICNESFIIKQQVKLLAHKNIKDRIMYYLNNNMIIKDNKRLVKIKSVKNLSDLLSLPRPSVSRELSNLEKEGIIIKINNIIYIK